MRVIRLLLLLLVLSPAAFAVPPTPTNTPRAHPLAPNPHTSVGLFWIYTDPNTGRQWIGGTYKVKRCSGVGCTPTVVVATGLTHADYQDTGLTSNTTYGYRYLANDGTGDSSDSPTVYVTTLAADSNMVQFPDSVWANLLGPLPEAAQIPFSWYNSTATTNGLTLISKYPIVGPGRLKGTGSINNGSTALTGTSTFFLEQVSASNPACLNHISINGVDAGAIASINSNTSITLASPWSGTNQSGVTLSTNVPQCGFGDPFNDYVTSNQLMYYDSEFALWQLYFSTGDPRFLRGAIQGSEAVFAGFMWLGRNRAWSTYSTTPNTDNMPAPRNFQFSGFVLLGMAGHNGVWDLLDDYLTNRYSTWISNYRGGNNDFTYIREKAYTITFTSWFVTAAPDSFPRGNGTTTSLNGSTTVDGSLATGRKGFWKTQLETDLPGFITDDQTADGLWFETSAYGDFGDGDFPYAVTGGAFQPFIGGLLGDALGYCWDNPNLSATARNAARKMTLKLAAPLGLMAYNTNIVADEPGARWRSVHYFLEHGTRANPYAFMYGTDDAILNNTPDNNMIQQYRQAIPLMLSTLGRAWQMSGHAWYKTQADEMANAAFAEIGENTIGSGADGKKSLCNNTGNFKDYGQCYRSAQRYFGYRLTTPSSLGTAPVITMPSNVTLTSGVNQASLAASVTCTNTPCAYKWFMVEYPQVLGRQAAQAVFYPDDAVSTRLSGMEPGVYKVGFYALDALGLEGHGTVNVTVGDGAFPPVAEINQSGLPWIGTYTVCTTSTSLSNINVRAYSAAGRSLTHSFSGTGPKDKTAPTITPSGTTGNVVTVTMSGLSAGWWTMKDVVTDSAGATRSVYFYLVQAASCGSFGQPLVAHNTLPLLVNPPLQVLPAGSNSTRLYVVPVDPEGTANYGTSAVGYFIGYNGSYYVVGALTHSWTQTGGPVAVSITNASTVSPTVTGLTQAGTYTFLYSGIDQQGDIVTSTSTVVVQGGSGITVCRWASTPQCQSQ